MKRRPSPIRRRATTLNVAFFGVFSIVSIVSIVSTVHAARAAGAEKHRARPRAPSVASAVVQHRTDDGTLPEPRRPTCVAGTPPCEAVRVQLRAGGPVVMRHQPRFHGKISALDAHLRRAMTGVSWRPGCPVPLDALRLITVDHWRPDGSVATGRLIVAAADAPVVLGAFTTYFRVRFPISHMAPIYTFGGSDDRSMKADNTSAFNCRKITGGERWSEHAYGTAIDINPLRNPYVKGKLVLPATARSWAKRRRVRPGMLVRHGPSVAVWRRAGWGWGGRWRTLQDYQHVSKSGR